MPHGRKKGKRVVGMWIDEPLFKAIDELAKRSGLPRSKVAEMIIRREMEKLHEKESVHGSDGR